jgi:hypothetical protein
MDDSVLTDRARLVEPKPVNMTCRNQPGRAADEKLPNHFVIELGRVARRQVVDVAAIGLSVIAGLSFVPEIDVLGRIVRIVRPFNPVAVGEVIVANVEDNDDSLPVARLDELAQAVCPACAFVDGKKMRVPYPQLALPSNSAIGISSTAFTPSSTK